MYVINVRGNQINDGPHYFSAVTGNLLVKLYDSIFIVCFLVFIEVGKNLTADYFEHLTRNEIREY